MLGWVEVDCCCAVVVAVDNVDMIAQLMSTATL